MKLLHLIYLVPLLTAATCRIYSIENPDGSYSTGLTSDSRGETANSVVALLAKSGGYNLNNEGNSVPSLYQPQEYFAAEPQIGSQTESRVVLSPHLEILQLIETFIRFKGEMASRLHAIVADNFDIIRSVYLTAISKIGTLHSFTLTGIRILRTILEFAAGLMAQWQINVPGVSLDLNVGSQGNQGAALHLTKDPLMFGRQ